MDLTVNQWLGEFDSHTRSKEFLLGDRLVWPKATVFEIVIMGSNPIPSAKIWAVSDNGSTLALHVRGKSSILLRSTK